MDTDISAWLDYLNKNNNRKRKRDETEDINSDEIINELKLMGIYSLEDIIKENNFKGRQLTSLLNRIEESLKKSKIVFNDEEIDHEFRLMVLAFSSIIIELINDIKLEIYSNGKDFNVIKYMNFLKNQYSNKKRKLPDKISNIDIIFDSNITKDGFLKDGFVVDDNEIDESLEEDSEYDTTDSENTDDVDYEITKHCSFDLLEKYDSKDKEINKMFVTELNRTMDNVQSSKDNIMRYFCNLDNDYKKELIHKFKNVNNCLDNDQPVMFKILNMPVTSQVKKTLLNKLLTINSGLGENNKLRAWLDNIIKLPFGIYKGINIDSMKPRKVKKFIKKLTKEMDNAVWGHDNAKRKIIQMMAQKIRNPDCKGSVLGIWGPPGNGKTTLIKDGIAKAMDKPFIFISLGGATDASFLEGHSYTYEGSIYGRIARAMIEAQCMDPIIYFDELDKISNTRKGEEITNLLIHLIDPSQNTQFRDKYFHDIDIDLSKVTFIFSFNRPSHVNYILMDRITTVETKHLTIKQKVHIANNYLLPNILKDIGLDEKSITISKNIIVKMIDDYTHEGGVRKLKKLLYEICRELNVSNLTKTSLCNTNINFPLNVDKVLYNKILENHTKYTHDVIHKNDSIGIVNGLWANSMGVGGILPIESLLIPSKGFMEVKATGLLEQVIKESIEVALSVAWNNITDELKEQWLEKWKINPQCFHIHCPDGAVPKDGPSAGAALSLVLYSRLTDRKINHTVAMTGEINLRGEVTRIGGLEEKLTGAKVAGVKTVLIPKENEEDLIKIKKRNSTLLNEKFKIIVIKNFNDVLKYSLVKN